MDFKEKVSEALRRSIHPVRIELEDDDGISGYVVADDFRGLSSLDRQTLIDKALRDSSAELSKADLRRILMIAALTPAEYESARP